MGRNRGDDRKSLKADPLRRTIDTAKWRAKRGVARVLDALGADQGLTRYVGGAVRDDLLEIPFNDLDFATRIEPDEVVARLKLAKIKAVPTGLDHGTVTAVSDGHALEITTLRRDVSTDGRRATIAFTGDWKEDAARRDFTINALLADPETGEIYDYFGGIEDLAKRRVRFIGDPLERIAEDHLRILRFFRFHARFGAGQPDRAAVEACAQRANDLMALSRERIADEILKLLDVDNPVPTVELMHRKGIFAPVLPEIDDAGVAALDRLVEAESQSGLAPDPYRRLSALIPRDPQVAEDIAARLRLSNKARKRLAVAAQDDTATPPRALAFRLGSAGAVDRLLLADRAGDAAMVAAWPVPRLRIRGNDLMKRGVPQGPAIARTLKHIQDRWVAADFDDSQLPAIVDEEVATALRG